MKVSGIRWSKEVAGWWVEAQPIFSDLEVEWLRDFFIKSIRGDHIPPIEDLNHAWDLCQGDWGASFSDYREAGNKKIYRFFLRPKGARKAIVFTVHPDGRVDKSIGRKR